MVPMYKKDLPNYPKNVSDKFLLQLKLCQNKELSLEKMSEDYQHPFDIKLDKVEHCLLESFTLHHHWQQCIIMPHLSVIDDFVTAFATLDDSIVFQEDISTSYAKETQWIDSIFTVSRNIEGLLAKATGHNINDPG